MKYTLERLLCLSAAATALCLTTPVAMAASTALWIGNPGVTATTNWSDNANWSVAPLQNDAKFGGTGFAADLDTITSVVDANQAPLSLQYTNNSISPSLQFHNTFIPTGVILSVGNGSLTVGGITADSYRTQVKITGGGTLLVTNGLSIGNNGSTGSDQQTRLDLSGLTNFVYNAPAATITMGSGNRSAGDFTLAANSNYITAATWNANIASSSSGVSGTLNLGAGTNVINVNTFAIGGNRGNCTVNLPAAAGLRLRGAGGTDSDRANMTLGNHNASGTGSTAAGTLNFNGATVDMKIGTLTMGQSGGGATGGSNPGNGTLNFDTGVVDANAINMAITSGSSTFNSANGTINVGANGTLIVGAGGISMVNLGGSAPAASGTLSINGGTNLVSGNIRKTSIGGTATINLNGTLKLIGSTNTIGLVGNPIDTINLTDSKLSVPVNNGGATIIANNFNANGSTDTINVTSLPGIATFPTQLPVITYMAFNGNYDFVLGSLPGTYQGYLSNNTAGFSIDLVITNSQVKVDTWRGNVSGNWDTTTLNWFSGGAINYQQGDLVVFDDTLTGTANVNLTTTLLPQAVSVNNSVFNYAFSGTGKLSGNTSLTKSGTGTLSLTETGADDFTGGILVSGGTLILDSPNATIAGGLTVNAGTAQIGNNDANGVVPSGGITDDGLLVFNTLNNLTAATAITGNGSVVQKGSGRLTFTGANTYGGTTIVSNGTFALSGAGSMSSPLTVNNAMFDISALSQPTLLNGFNVTNSTTTLQVIGGVTNIVATSIACGGAGNIINVTAIPPIASYPVTFAVMQSGAPINGNFNFSVGSLPAATPAYAANVTQSPDQTAVLLTVTAGPIGARPSVLWVGADVPNLNTNWSDRLNWQLPGAPLAGENAVFNNTASVFASALSTPGGGSSALIFDNVNNIVDANFALGSLTYTNASDSYHNTFIKAGDSLSTSNLTVGAFDSGGGAQHEFVTVSGGANSSLTVSNSASNLQIWVGSGSVGGSQATLDLSALDNFNATVSRLTIGASAINNVVNRPSGILYLAKTNSIKAGFQTTTIEAGTTTGNAGIVLGDCNGNAGSASSLYLGQVNTISADTIGMARQKTTATIQFNPLYANVAPYPTVTFQGFSSGLVSVFEVGDGVGNTGTTTTRGLLNLNGGIVTANVDTMNIGRGSSGGTTSGGTSGGTLQFDAGTITVNTMNLGWQAGDNLKVGAGTNNVGSNTVIGVAATLVVKGSLNIAFAAGTNSMGLLSITNGNVLANRIVPGTNSVQALGSSIGVYGGLLVATNPVGNATAALTSLTLAPLGTPDNSRNTLNVPVGYNTPGIMVTNLSIDGLDTTTNVINIESVGPAATAGVELPIIQYQTLTLTAGATFNVGLGTLPAGYAGVLTNDTASSTIGLVLTSAIHPQPHITALTQVGNALTMSGANGFANGPFHVLTSTDVSVPLSTWTAAGSGVFGPTGAFSFTAAIDPAKPQQFFIVQVP